MLQAKGKTSDAITKLCQLAPPTALLVEVDDKGAVVREEEVPTALVHRGDLLKVRHSFPVVFSQADGGSCKRAGVAIGIGHRGDLARPHGGP